MHFRPLTSSGKPCWWPAVIAPGVLSFAACTKPPSAFFAQMVREAGQNPRIAACPSTHVCSSSATLRCDVRLPVLACAYSQCRTMRASSHHAYIAIARDCSRQISSSHSCTRCDTVACGRKMQCVYMWLLRPSPATTCTSPSDTDLVCAEPIHCERAHLRNMARLLQPHHHRRGSFWPLRMLESLRRQGNLL